MRFNEFLKDVKNKNGVDTDGYFGKQCMDLYNYYCNNVLGLQNVGASCAKEILNNRNIMDNVERIDNYPAFVPQRGDIAVGNIGGYGHVCICLGEGDTKYFRSLDQNWKPQQLTEEKHNYLDMGKLTFLRPKNQENIKEPTNFTVRVDKLEANVRTAPNTNSACVAQPGGYKCLVKGNTFQAVDVVRGQYVDGTDLWYKSARGNYVHSYGLTKM